MSDDQAPDDIESQVAAFAAEIDSAIDVNLKGFESDVVRLLGLLLSAPDSSDVFSAVMEFSAAAQSTTYVTFVLDKVMTTWAGWVLHEGNTLLFNAYIRHLHTFVLAARVVGVTSISEADSESFGDSAEDGQQNV
jgi:hypothetical protein